MFHFERIGREWQESATSAFQARKSFRRSCEICCERGYRIDCDRCEIRAAHERQLDVLRFLDQERFFPEASCQPSNGTRVPMSVLVKIVF